MEVLSKLDELWKENEREIVNRIQGWVDDLSAQEKRVVEARRQFHQWEPLRVYISTSQAKKKGAPRFSLRYCGQEVATLILKPDGKLYVSIGAGTQSTNARDFGVPIETSRSFPWDSPEGREFRKHFKKHTREHPSAPRIREHLLESMIIKEMRRKTAAKFDNRLGQIRPVLLYGILPFQVPIPFSASGREPELSKRGGTIDILARRRGEDGHVRLSVWELKRPGQIGHAVFQSYIYAVTLRYMLRASSGAKWFKLFGLPQPLRAPLDVESVVLLSEDKRNEYTRQVAALCEHNEMIIGKDRIILSVGFYDDTTLRLTSFKEGSAPPL